VYWQLRTHDEDRVMFLAKEDDILISSPQKRLIYRRRPT
jgi:hypothetical protein